MKKLIAILALALAIPTMSFAGDAGRYQGIAGGTAPSGESYMWLVDTKTGSLSKEQLEAWVDE
mgnify:CR=1 FL=1